MFVEDWPACVLAEDYSDRMSGGGDRNISFTRQGKVWLPEVSDVIDTTSRGADLHVSLTGLACLRGGRGAWQGAGEFLRDTRNQRTEPSFSPVPSQVCLGWRRDRGHRPGNRLSLCFSTRLWSPRLGLRF